MKPTARIVVIAALLGVPFATFAQSNAEPTRAQVKAELVRLEQAGYDPAGSSNDYPVALRAAEAKVAQQDADRTTQSFAGKSEELTASASR